MADKSKIIKDAQKFVAKGQIDKAVEEYNKILARTPGDTSVLNTVGDLYLKKGDKTNAIESFKKAADQFSKGGFTLKAIALYKKVLNIKSDQVDVLMMMGKLNAERSMLGSANEYYLSAASYFTQQGMKTKALDVYKTLCNLNPTNLSLAQTLADLYMAEGMESEGIGKFIELAEKSIALGSYDEAREFLSKASKKGSSRYDFIKTSAKLDLMQNRLPEAVEKLEQAREMDHGDNSVAALLGEAHHRSGNYEKAEALFRRLVDRFPENHDYRVKFMEIMLKTADFDAAWKQCVNLVQDHIYNSEFDKAEKLLDKYLEQKSDSVEALQLLSDVYAKTGRENKIGALHKDMADIYAGKGETDKAFNIYSKILEKDPGNVEIKAKMSGLGHIGAAAAPAEDAPAQPPVEPENEAASVPEMEMPSMPDMVPPSAPEMEMPSVPDMEPPSVPEMEMPSVPDMEPPSVPEMEMPSVPGMEPPSVPEMEPPSVGESTPEPDAEDIELDFPPLGITDEPEGLQLGSSMLEQDHETPEETSVPGENVYELPDVDMGELDRLDIFDTSQPEAAAPVLDAEAPGVNAPELEEAEGPESVPDIEPGAVDEDFEVEEEPATVAERLGQIDVYINYGFIPMAQSAVDELLGKEPDNPDIIARQINICKANDDIAGMVVHSIRLADIYDAAGMEQEAAGILASALELAPGNRELVERAGAAPELEQTMGRTLAQEYEEAADAAVPAKPFTQDDAGEAVLEPNSVEFIEQMAEADFYAQQGLVSEARLIYKDLLKADPDNPELKEKYENCDKVWDMPSEPEAEVSAPGQAAPWAEQEAEAVYTDFDAATEVTAASKFDTELDEAFSEFDNEVQPPPETDVTFEDTEFFDLASELKDELDEPVSTPGTTSGPFKDKFLDDAFQEFKKGVEDQLSQEDYETHYNLGIAYKEMGMVDEALEEFKLASKDPSRNFDCASMLGLCRLEKGEFDQAIEHFETGLEIQGREDEEYMGLRYYIANAHELSGDIEAAYRVYTQLYRADKRFRDVRERMKNLTRELNKAGIDPDKIGEREPEDSGQPKKPAKKSKVSYI